MRLPLLALLMFALAACPSASSTEGPQGPAGATGPVGSAGAIGATGPAGAMGVTGAMGATGPQGPKGDTGDTGAQGLQGPAGVVTVVDGGVVTGPPGSSVLVTAVTPGATCATGGVGITQLSDAGIVNVCNGAVGATGPAGAQGIQGLPGAAVGATALPTMSAQCAAGGVLLQLPDAGTLALCNGATGLQGPAGAQGLMGATGPAGAQGLQGVGATGPQGPQGLTGTTGPAGAQGLTGPQGAQGLAGPQGLTGATGATGAAGAAGTQGPQGLTGATGLQGPTGNVGPQGPSGPAGAVLYLDGGSVVALGDLVEFAGFTVATYTGDLGGLPGANAKCTAEFTSASLCTRADYDLANTSAAPPSSGVWVDYSRVADGSRSNSACYFGGTNEPWSYGGVFNGSGGQQGSMVTAYGRHTVAPCSLVKPLACCRAPSRLIFRGFTSATYTGNLGGLPGANGKCSSEFPGASLCTRSDYDLANTSAAPTSSGAWIDYSRATDGTRSSLSCYFGGTNEPWSYGGAFNGSGGQLGPMVTSFGRHTVAHCSLVKPLACCSRR